MVGVFALVVGGMISLTYSLFCLLVRLHAYNCLLFPL